LAELGVQEVGVPEYLKITEVAQMLRLGERAVYEMLRTGRIPGAAKAGGKWRVDRDKLVGWMEAGGELQAHEREDESDT
jgi:excisionase family DNA binding protein